MICDKKHTPIPWTVESEPRTRKLSGDEIWSDGILVAKMAGLAKFDFDNADLIVTAVNAYDKHREIIIILVKALKELKECVETDPDVRIECPDHLLRAKEALTKAKEVLK